MEKINKSVFDKHGADMFYYLCLCNSNIKAEFADDLDVLHENQKIYLEKGYIKLNKAKKGLSEAARIRITKEGRKILDEYFSPEVDENISIIANWVADFYKTSGKKVGNKKRFTLGLQQFSDQTGLVNRELSLLIKYFIEDEKNMQWNNVLEYMLFDNKNIYNRKFYLKSCRLYEYYLTLEKQIN